MRNLRAVAALVFFVLVATACGSRLTPEQRQLVLSGNAAAAGAAAGGVGAGTTGTGLAPGGAGGTGAGPGTVAGTTPDVAGSTGTTGTTTGTTGTGGTTTTGTGGNTPAGTPAPGGNTGTGSGGNQGGSGGNTGGGQQGEGNWQAAPAGGNGGETDTGVSETEIVVANVSDTSGAVPDLFRDAQLAVQAYIAYFTNTYGTVYGRKLKYLPLDSQLSSGQNRNKYLQACEDSFAAVGSMSAFEQGGKEPIQECGLPDLRTAAVNKEMMALPTVYPADASRVGLQPMAEYQFWKKKFPQAVKHSAYLYIDSETTDFQTGQVKAATEKIGYHWDVYQSIPLSQTNYSSYVLAMKREGVRYVTFQGAYQQAVRLAEYMDQQGFKPDVYALQSNAYTPDYISSGGSVVEGTNIAIPSVIIEEINQHQELQLYATWLQQVDPNAKPTGLGIYAWSAASMFVDALKEAGPKLTREGLIDALKDEHEFTGNGLLPAQNIGDKYPADCVVVVKVQGGQFVREEPKGNGFSCSKPVKV